MKEKMLRIMAKHTDKSGGDDACWPWTAFRDWAGYGKVNVSGEGVRFAHRVLWTCLNGPIEKGLEVDHRCHHKWCQNPSHLRLATHAENNRYQNTRKNNTSGHKGVCWDKSRKKWLVKIRVNYLQIGLGRFSNIDDAIEAYRLASIKYHGEYSTMA